MIAQALRPSITGLYALLNTFKAIIVLFSSAHRFAASHVFRINLRVYLRQPAPCIPAFFTPSQPPLPHTLEEIPFRGIQENQNLPPRTEAVGFWIVVMTEYSILKNFRHFSLRSSADVLHFAVKHSKHFLPLKTRTTRKGADRFGFNHNRAPGQVRTETLGKLKEEQLKVGPQWAPHRGRCKSSSNRRLARRVSEWARPNQITRIYTPRRRG
jgi:hypothetical protein